MSRLLAAAALALSAAAPRAAADFTWVGDWQGALSSSPSAGYAAAAAYASASNLNNQRGTVSREVVFSRTFRIAGDPTPVTLSATLAGYLSQTTAGPGGSVFASGSARVVIPHPSGDLVLNYSYSGPANTTWAQGVSETGTLSREFPAGDYTVSGRLSVLASSLSGPTTAVSDFQSGGYGFVVMVAPVPEPAGLLIAAAGVLAWRVRRRVQSG